MKAKWLNRRLLWLIIILGLGLRVWQFGSIPSVLNRDEAALGYNAWAVAHYGVDEWGQKYPLMFPSFGDYKLPGYVYILTPLVRVIGTESWVIRLPSLLAGFGLIFLTYSLIKRVSQSSNLALAATAALSISPWAIFYSRMASEAHVGLFFLSLTLYGLVAIKGKRKYVFMAFFYLLSLLTYNSPFILLPVLVILAWWVGRSMRQRITMIVSLVIPWLVFVGLFFPLLTQKSGISVFFDPTLAHEYREDFVGSTTLVQKVWNYRYIWYSRQIGERLLDTFSPNFLVVSGGQNPWHSLPGRGHFPWLLYGLAGVGLAGILAARRPYFSPLIGLVLLLGSTLPAIITVDSPHATRSLFLFWMLSVLAGMGIEQLHRYQAYISGALLVAGLFFAHSYLVDFKGYSSPDWPLGLDKALVQTRSDLEKPVVILPFSPSSDLVGKQLYIYVLLYRQVNPTLMAEVLENAPRDPAGIIRVPQGPHFMIGSEGGYNTKEAFVIREDSRGRYDLIN